MQPWVWGRMRLYGVQGTQSVRADDEPETRSIIGEQGSTLRLTTTERRLKPRTSHFSRKSAAPRLHRRLEKILPIEFSSGHLASEPEAASLKLHVRVYAHSVGPLGVCRAASGKLPVGSCELTGSSGLLAAGLRRDGGDVVGVWSCGPSSNDARVRGGGSNSRRLVGNGKRLGLVVVPPRRFPNAPCWTSAWFHRLSDTAHRTVLQTLNRDAARSAGAIRAAS